MIELSLTMIVKNEEQCLARCLDSVINCVDEIIIVDTGSTDATKEIAGRYTDKIYDFEWIDDFAAARNFSLEHVTKDYAFFMDADDVLSDERKLIELKSQLTPEIDAVEFSEYQFDDSANPTFCYWRIRLFKRIQTTANTTFRWKGRIHEGIEASGNVIRYDINIFHLKVKDSGDLYYRILESVVSGGEYSNGHLHFYAYELMIRNKSIDAIKYFKLHLENGGYNDMLGVHSFIYLNYLYVTNGMIDESMELIEKSIQHLHNFSEFCCHVADFFGEDNPQTMLFWLKKAITCPIPVTNVYNSHFYYFIPYHKLGLLCKKIGLLSEAKEYLLKCKSMIQQA